MNGRYRWVILGAGAAGAGAFSALRMGLPALGPALRHAYGLSLPQVGLAFTAVAVGVMLTLVPWGVLTDRIGERPVMSVGLALTAGALAAAAFAPSYPLLLTGFLVAGMAGASATGASGRAIMGWFARSERGLALGIRQMALPLGGAAASVSLPHLVGAHGLRGALLALAVLCLTAALVCAALLRDPPADDGAATLVAAPERPAPTRDRRVWRLGVSGALLVVAQSAMLGFLVLFLHDARGMSAAAAAGALALVQLLGAGARIVAGRRSDRGGRRIVPLRKIAVRNTVLLLAVALLAAAPAALLFPVLLCAAVSTMSWNGLSFTAAAEISGKARAGTAMSLQNTILAIGGAAAPVLFGTVVDATSWTAAFALVALAPLAAFVVLAPLEGEEEARIADRERRLRAAARRRGSCDSSPRPAPRARPMEARS
ncbi:MAG TPA: MFS transporter [Solirubrobacteraceae bacterium]|nr:MFS transporter [Solirubrobacteraceae bacterium]